MGILKENNIDRVYHYTPLHYLPFIGRSQSLNCKPSLRNAGFPETHFRSMSRKQDIVCGFAPYTHLSLKPYPRILEAKLAAGFPHIGLSIPVSAIEATEFSLCRFNVAMTRFLRRDGKPGFPESATNGRYFNGHQIPIARSNEDKRSLLAAHLSKSTIEVLIHGDLPLPLGTIVDVFSPSDADTVASVLNILGAPWQIEISSAEITYPRTSKYVEDVERFIEKALADPAWRGDGLEFDRV